MCNTEYVSKPLPVKVPLHCNNCGDLFMSDLVVFSGRFCCKECYYEFVEKVAQSICGKEYKP